MNMRKGAQWKFAGALHGEVRRIALVPQRRYHQKAYVATIVVDDIESFLRNNPAWVRSKLLDREPFTYVPECESVGSPVFLETVRIPAGTPFALNVYEWGKSSIAPGRVFGSAAIQYTPESDYVVTEFVRQVGARNE